MCRPLTQTHYSMIGVIILCLPQTRISPGRTTGISFLCAHTHAHTYGLFTRLVPLGLSSPLHGGLLRLMRKTSKHAPSVLEHASAVTQTWRYFGYEMTRKQSFLKKWQEDLNLATVNASAVALPSLSRCNLLNKLQLKLHQAYIFSSTQTALCWFFMEHLRCQKYYFPWRQQLLLNPEFAISIWKRMEDFWEWRRMRKSNWEEGGRCLETCSLIKQSWFDWQDALGISTGASRHDLDQLLMNIQ